MEMEPRVQTRMLGILTSLLSVRFTEESRILDDLAEWEKKTRDCEEQSKEMMTDNMKKAVIMQALNEVKSQMQLKQQVDTYNDFRAQLRDHVLARRAWSEPTPMSVDAM